MITQELTTSNGEYIAVLLPDDATDVTINDSVLAFGSNEQDPLDVGGDLITLPGTQYELIGKISTITEEQAALVVDVVIVNGGGELYRNYGEGLFQSASAAKKTKLESFRTLTDSMEVYAVNPNGEEPNPADYFNTKTPIDQFTEKDKQGLTEYGSKDMDWEYAQSRTGNWYLLKKIK